MSPKRRFPRYWLAAAAAAVALWTGACGTADEPSRTGAADPVAVALEQGFQVDTVGVRNLAEGDTLNQHPGLTIIETTVTFQPSVTGGEVIAWEFYAEALRPVKLILVRYAGEEKSFELVGESPMVVPAQLGVNRITLPEPIPVEYGTMFGIYQPEEGTVPFRRVRNWKTLITANTFQRPFTPRTLFAMYGWRYAARVFYRYRGGAAAEGDSAGLADPADAGPAQSRP